MASSYSALVSKDDQSDAGRSNLNRRNSIVSKNPQTEISLCFVFKGEFLCRQEAKLGKPTFVE
jgi:hypothetical protein